MTTSEIGFRITVDLTVGIDEELGKQVLDYLEDLHKDGTRCLETNDVASIAREQLCLKAYKEFGVYGGMAEVIRTFLHSYLRQVLSDTGNVTAVTEVAPVCPKIEFLHPKS